MYRLCKNHALAHSKIPLLCSFNPFLLILILIISYFNSYYFVNVLNKMQFLLFLQEVRPVPVHPGNPRDARAVQHEQVLHLHHVRAPGNAHHGVLSAPDIINMMMASVVYCISNNLIVSFLMELRCLPSNACYSILR